MRIHNRFTATCLLSTTFLLLACNTFSSPEPTATPSPAKPAAGAVFKGTFDGGTLEFIIDEKGTSIKSSWQIAVMGEMTCAEGHTAGAANELHVYAGLSPIPIQDGAFKQGDFRGQFDSETTASGNLEVMFEIFPSMGPPTRCTIGPVEWTARAE